MGIASMISIPLQAIQAISCASFCVFYLFGKPLNFLHMLLQYMWSPEKLPNICIYATRKYVKNMMRKIRWGHIVCYSKKGTLTWSIRELSCFSLLAMIICSSSLGSMVETSSWPIFSGPWMVEELDLDVFSTSTSRHNWWKENIRKLITTMTLQQHFRDLKFEWLLNLQRKGSKKFPHKF